MASKIMFVAGLGRFLRQFDEPLAQALQHEGYVTIGVAADMAESVGFDRTYSLPPFRRRGPIAALRALASLHDIVIREQPNLLRLHTPPAVGLGRLVAKQLGIPSIAMISSTFLDTISQLAIVFRLGEIACARWSATTIASNSQDAAFYRRHAPFDTVVQAPVGGIGVDLDLIHKARAAPSQLPGRPAVIVVGRLTREKRLNLVTDAFAAVRSRAPNASLTFLGSAHAGDSAWSIPTEPGISHVPWVEDPYPLIAGADVLVSASGREAFSMVVAEAILLGTPAVSTQNRGVADIELIAPGRVQVVQPTPHAIAAAILLACQQPRRSGLDDHLAQRWCRANAIAFHSTIIHRNLQAGLS